MTKDSAKPAAKQFDFTRSEPRIAALLQRMHEISDLTVLGGLAAWDQNTALPPGAGEIRGQQLATLQGVLHERWTATSLGELIGEVGAIVEKAPYTDADRALVRESRRAYDHATKLPRGLVEEMARVESGAFEAWRKARENRDFASFAPWLSRTVALQREVADRYGYAETRYDALLDLYEPGMTASRLDVLFTGVRNVSVNLLRRIQASGTAVDDACLKGKFAGDQQVKLAENVLKAMGYDFSRGLVAQSPHPFTEGFGSPFDVRLTVHPDERFVQAAVMAAIHEGGHAVYEQGSATTLARTPLAGGASLGVHESQSRLWENAIGRSDAFWKGQFHLVREAFPRHFGSVEPEVFARALNKVQPSLIRIEADEVTYNLHIIVRFEIEKALVNGEVAIESLPTLWNSKYKDYIGVKPRHDGEGVLQDIHWTSGFGYFPTYTLGNLYGAQIFHRLRTVFPDFDSRLAEGDTSFVLKWLQEHMYAAGAVYMPDDLVKRVTGEAPDPKYFAAYLDEKFSRVYNLPPAPKQSASSKSKAASR